MIVVGDTGPLNYLLLIGEVEILPSLFTSVVIPRTVARELSNARAPEVGRTWVEHPPSWLEILPDPAENETLAGLDAGERCAIALALLIRATEVLMDDQAGRIEAERRNLRVTGTLGILVEAHHRRLLDFDHALVRRSTTSMFISARLLQRFGNCCSRTVTAFQSGPAAP